ncbi:rSAM-partnered protein [Halorubrum sp. GN11_10-6_MGM]|uniref:Htur_1727 family rSAM-partnered candidate RiPP n=1 Tax=Halorubrum sp. GN11_10-6_MGM TaxID=2518112 RepID=UPI0010F55E4E|nr:Htur_1727 family rSAM-partnered candidate RiPP [Halorubrum sp. GN11_10-6_MGM]TKX73941.1 rSAM-partnered protein [Halorubrum sp. GN11_10-6_MGM]
MVEKTNRSEDASGVRSADGRRFEVFVRDEESDPLRHVGTVAAPTPDAAHEEASKLFAWYARDVWVCPAAEVSRYSAASMADDGATGAPEGADDGEAPDDDEDAAAAEDAADTEQRVYEETEGTPTASSGGAPVDRDGDDAAESPAEGSR